MPTSKEVRDARRKGNEVAALEDEYEDVLEQYRNKKTPQLKARIDELGDKLYAKRSEGRQAEVKAGMRTEGFGVKVEDNK